jgi:hypothetical protein
MFADWLQAVQQAGGPALAADMFRGAEAYLEMWERAFGVPVSGCRYRHGSFGVSGTRDLRLGVGSTSVLYALGQPSDRPGWSYRYCVAGAPGRTVSGVFTAAGRVGLWVTDAPGYVTSVGGIRPGVPAARVARVAARSLGGGLWLGRGMSRGSRYVFRVRGGRVAVVGVAARSVARSDGAVRAAVRASGL